MADEIFIGETCEERSNNTGTGDTFIQIGVQDAEAGTIDEVGFHRESGSGAGFWWNLFFESRGTFFARTASNINVNIEASDGCKIFTAPGDFTAQAHAAGDMLGFYSTGPSMDYNTSGESTGFATDGGDDSTEDTGGFAVVVDADGALSIFGQGDAAAPAGRPLPQKVFSGPFAGPFGGPT